MEHLVPVAIWGVLVFGVLGLIFGIALAATARRFHTESDPLVEEVKENLPAANCGACGYAGCQGYAEAVVGEESVAPTKCTPGGFSVAEIVAALTHKKMGEVKSFVAVMKCSGTTAVAINQAAYEGIPTCTAASLAFGGPKACKSGCLGLGDCERICPFDAIHVKEDGIAVVDKERCTGCGLCISICPKNVLALYPRNHRVELACVAKDKAPVVRPTCLVGCTTCRRCVMACPAGAISWSGKTIEIDHEKCLAYGPSCEEVCVQICPTSVLHHQDEHAITEAQKKAQRALAQDVEAKNTK